MKRLISLLFVIILFSSCSHYRWYYMHKDELCNCKDTVIIKEVIIKEPTYFGGWEFPQYVPYNPESEYNGIKLVLDTNGVLRTDPKIGSGLFFEIHTDTTFFNY